MGCADGEHFLTGVEFPTLTEVGMRKLQAAALHFDQIDAQEREVGPVIPPDEFRADAFEVGKGDVDFNRLGTDHMSIREHETVRRKNHPRANPAGESFSTRFKGDLPHINLHNGFEELLKPALHVRTRWQDEGGSKENDEDERGD